MPNSILITGGLGYIGGRIASYFSKARPGVKIVLATRRNPEECPAWATRMNLKKIDFKDTKSLLSSLEGVDAVIHLAALNEKESKNDPLSSIDVNIKGVYSLLKASVEVGVERFIYFSTFHVYGKNTSGQVTERTPTRSAHPYAFTHLAAEGVVDFFRVESEVKTLIFRLSNGYGCPMDLGVNCWTLVFNDLCLQAVRDGRIALRTSGQQHRDFIALNDVARAVEHMFFVAPDSWGDGLFNLGGRNSLRVLDVAHRIAAVFEKKFCGRKIPINIPASNERETVYPVDYSIEKLYGTGFSLLGDMDQEIARTIDAVREMCNE